MQPHSVLKSAISCSASLPPSAPCREGSLCLPKLCTSHYFSVHSPFRVSHKQVIKFVNGQWFKAPSISEFMCLAVCLPTMSRLFWLPAWSIYHWQSSDCIVKLSGKCVHSPFAFTILSNAYFRVVRSWDVKSFNQIPHFFINFVKQNILPQRKKRDFFQAFIR